ncbi:hypothetical protein FDECE_3245 [Fusarium decemcellulare]|nr:hypothetical protein FDECE_3245 [Fusarium decemcellulare]
MVVSKAWDLSVADRVNYMVKKLDDAPDFRKKNVPGLRDLLAEYASPDVLVDRVEFHRRMLRVFKDSKTDGTYSETLKNYDDDERRQIEEFVVGGKPETLCHGFSLKPSLGCRDELSRLRDEARSIFHVTAAGFKNLRDAVEELTHQQSALLQNLVQKLSTLPDKHKDDATIQVFENAPFQNWGLNVENTPRITCVPKSTWAIQAIVMFANEQNMSVRCSGYRHSWSPIFGRNGQILISLINLNTATKLPNFAALPFAESPPTELETIDIVDGKPRTPGNTLVRIGCATTNERLRRWCVKQNKVTIPLNIIMVEITQGGSNGPICHGAGRRHKTLSDLVRKIEYVDANGQLRVVDKAEHLRAASGCFGLMGVVTHITLEFEPMTYAQLAPLKIPVIQAVPPPPGMDEKRIPPSLLKDWKNLTPTEKEKCQKDFEQRATNDYYSEWFWFPYADNAWVNTWNNTKDANGVEDFPTDKQIFLSFIQTFLMNVLQNAPLLRWLIDELDLSEAAVTLISAAAMKALPESPVKTYLPDALHFQRAIQNVRVRDLEVEMPLVAKAGAPPGTIDYAPVQQAWWDAILLTYANTEDCPMRMPLEMRIMGGSEVIMAPQRGNSLGTCAIEVLTLKSAAVAGTWQPFAQSVLDKWMAVKDPSTGKRLRTRPHWAKEWYNFNVEGKKWVEHLKAVDYKDERQEFLQVLSDIGKDHGWTLQDLKNRFSNDLFDNFFFDGVVGKQDASSGANGKH